MAIIIILLSIILDGIISNYLGYMNYNLSIFTTFFTLISVFIVQVKYKKDLLEVLNNYGNLE